MPSWCSAGPKLHPEAAKFLDELHEAGVKPFYEVGLEAARARINENAVKNSLTFEFSGEILDIDLGEEDDEVKVPCYVYKPQMMRDDPVIIIFFHGGANCMGSRLNSDYACKLLSTKLRGIAVNVEYRLAPEHKFPANVDDACTVARWVLKHKAELGGSESSRVGVAGDSAGAAIAATAAHDVPGLAFEILIYPHLAAKGDRSLPSYSKYKYGPILSELELNYFEDIMCNPEDRRHPRIANLERKEFKHLPPTLIIVAECDPFHDDSIEYYRKLSMAGVLCKIHTIRGAIHGFYSLSKKMPSNCEEANEKIICFIESDVYRMSKRFLETKEEEKKTPEESRTSEGTSETKEEVESPEDGQSESISETRQEDKTLKGGELPQQ